MKLCTQARTFFSFASAWGALKEIFDLQIQQLRANNPTLSIFIYFYSKAKAKFLPHIFKNCLSLFLCWFLLN
jgi:hypothetical protein